MHTHMHISANGKAGSKTAGGDDNEHILIMQQLSCHISPHMWRINKLQNQASDVTSYKRSLNVHRQMHVLINLTSHRS